MKLDLRQRILRRVIRSEPVIANLDLKDAVIRPHSDRPVRVVGKGVQLDNIWALPPGEPFPS